MNEGNRSMDYEVGTTVRKQIRSFRDLGSQREAYNLVVDIYQITKTFPKDEILGLVSQMRRSSISITSNIAEGFNRFSIKEKIQFYSISLGFTAEPQSQLDVAVDVENLSNDSYSHFDIQAQKVHEMFTGLIKSTRNRL